MWSRFFGPKEKDIGIHVVFGISSCGKSSFINHGKKRGIFPMGAKVLMAYEIGDALPDGPCVIHYNLLRSYDNSLDSIGNSLDSDPVLQVLFSEAKRIRAYFLMVNKTVLLRRVLKRTHVEPVLRRDRDPYKVRDIFELLCHIDYSGFHQQWISCLSEHFPAMRLINSETNKYDEYSSFADLTDSLREPGGVDFTPEQVEEILTCFQFGPHSTQIYERVATQDDDRSDTIKKIKSYLVDRSVLLIGCGYGFHCFEAERHTRGRIVGLEPKRETFLGASLLKTLKNSNVVFQFEDIMENDSLPQFDTVLLLNVVHHQENAIDVLLKAAAIARRTLIIELPGPSDVKLESPPNAESTIACDLPYTGDGLPGCGDQMFPFAEKAIHTVLSDHDKLFESIEFLPADLEANRWMIIYNKLSAG